MTVKFEEVLRTLRQGDGPLSPAALRRFSNLSDAEQQMLVGIWGAVPLGRRLALLKEISVLIEEEFDTDFSAVTRLALTDLDDSVRAAAVDASWPDESPERLRRLMSMAGVDSSAAVRAAALSAMGHFILLGEYEEFDMDLARQAQNIALRIYNNAGEDVDVRRRALEAVSNSSRPEVERLIREAHHSDDARMRASAIFAMGRSADERWEAAVLRELDSTDLSLRFEAVRAAGELELEEAIPQLGRLLADGDREMRNMAVWSLGEIGGGEALRLLTGVIDYAREVDDDELLERAEEAFATASLFGGSLDFEE